MRLGKLLNLHRVVNHRDVKDLANDIGVGPSTLSRIERGKPCDMQSLGKLLTWLLTDDSGEQELIEK